MDYRSFEVRQKALDLPHGDARKAALTALLVARTRGSHNHARLMYMKSPLHMFCVNNGVSVDFAERTIAEANKYRSSITPPSQEDSYPYPAADFSRQEAITLVTNAFNAFDPAMGAHIAKAASENRIAFEDSHVPHMGWVHVGDYIPSAIAGLPRKFIAEAYVNVPLATDRLGLEDVFILAHECGHLAAAQTYIKAQGKQAPPSRRPLEESFALVGTHLLHEYLASQFKDKSECLGQVESAYHQCLHKDLFPAARIAGQEQEMSRLYTSLHERMQKLSLLERLPHVRSNLPEKLAFDAYLKKIVHEPHIGDLLKPESYYFLSYPLAAIASQHVFEAWKKGDKEIPNRWSAVARSAMNYGDAMRYMGINIAEPDILQPALKLYDSQSHVVDKLRISRAQSHLLASHFKQKPSEPLAPVHFSSAITQLGGVCQSVACPTLEKGRNG